MKKTKPILMLMAIFVVIFAAACGGGAPAPESNTEAVAPVVNDAVEPAAEVAPQVAVPINVADTVGVDTYCVKKIPYQNILLEPGTSFQPLDPTGEMKCSDSGTDVDGKDVISCTGKELWTYDLQLSNSSGASTTIKVNIGGCP